MADIITLITQSSATLTTLMGLTSLTLIFLAVRKLAKDQFRELINKSLLLVLLSLLGVTSMTVYHFIDRGYESEAVKLTETIWYVLMFAALSLSCYVSLSMASFGKKFSKLGKK